MRHASLRSSISVSGCSTEPRFQLRMPQRSSASAPIYVTGNAFTLNTVHDIIGREVLLETKKGDRYEGIFAAYGKDREIGLQSAYKLPKDGEPERLLPLRSETQKIIFPSTEYVTMSLVMNDDKGMREFATDADYHDRKIEANGGQLDDFEEWHDDDHGNGELGGDIEEISPGNGWAVQDMFKQNGSLVKSDFLDDLSQYTTVEVGQVSDEARERAEQIARDIESNAGSRRMQLLENDDEERDLDKATEFEKDNKDYIPSGRRPNRGMRGNAPPAQRGSGSMRGNRGGRQYNNNMQNFSNAPHSQQYGGNRGGFQSRQGNPNASRFGSDRQQNGSTSSSGEPWRQQNPSASQRRPVEPTPVGSYSAVVAAGMKQSSPAASNDVRMSSGNAPPSRSWKPEPPWLRRRRPASIATVEAIRPAITAARRISRTGDRTSTSPTLLPMAKTRTRRLPRTRRPAMPGSRVHLIAAKIRRVNPRRTTL
ncbi:hypothetical protein L596_010663 [Steinernema carpocapsae]|uniref:LsmAD domain-containing protein n=1 Tax=Steinernema carpocapsae TaxID=34508 RepID=A0A4U5PJ55_STECR|nr:hypothetical protein L596_010663 [Steinernema carpocapsae]